jgi:hypothetical protein
MVTSTSSRLTTVAASITRHFPGVQDFGARRLRVQPCTQTPFIELSLLPVGDGNPSARWTAQHEHPPQDQLLHEKFYSTWHVPDNPSLSCCNLGGLLSDSNQVCGRRNLRKAQRRREGTFPFHLKR